LRHGLVGAPALGHELIELLRTYNSRGARRNLLLVATRLRAKLESSPLAVENVSGPLVLACGRR
jgi:hypothetical protein